MILEGTQPTLTQVPPRVPRSIRVTRAPFSAALGAKLAPFRPWLAGLTVVFLGVAFYQAYKPVECEPGEACAIPASRRRHRIVLWIVALVALALMAFPYYVSWLF